MQQSTNFNWINFSYKTQPWNMLQHWTEGAIDCYKRGCNCQGCDLPHPTEGCNMKSAVIDLVRLYGSPEVYLANQKKKAMRDKEIVNKIHEMLSAGEQMKRIAVTLDLSMYQLKKLMDLNGLTIYVHRKRVFR